MAEIGFVYVLSNESMPGILKIGKTSKSPHQRAAELSSGTGIPTPFEVLGYVEIEEPTVTEYEAHVRFAENRVANNREFFRIKFVDAWEYLTRCCGPLAEAMSSEGRMRFDDEGGIQ